MTAARGARLRCVGLGCGGVRAPRQQLRRSVRAAVVARGLAALFFSFFYCESGNTAGDEPAVMAHPITADPNPRPGRTGSDAAF
jgi:hypothetical protein